MSERCCCGDWIAGWRATMPGGSPRSRAVKAWGASDALDVVQEAFHTLRGRPDIAALRARPATQHACSR